MQIFLLNCFQSTKANDQNDAITIKDPSKLVKILKMTLWFYWNDAITIKDPSKIMKMLKMTLWFYQN